MLKAKEISKYYGNLHVLKNIDLEVEKGEIVAITGPSGAGKSTLLHILSTLDKPDSGLVQIDNINVHELSEKKLSSFRNLKIGIVFQFHNLLPEFSALENIIMPALIAGKNIQDVKKRAYELAEILHIEERLEHKPSEMSGGEQQRTAVARALINQPLIVFADEPSGNLDSKNAEELHQLFFKLCKELQQTFLIVTHNYQFAQLATKRIEIKDGRIASVHMNEEGKL
ncbi:MAG: ABC transporter ATP-binding protein [Cytophagales bacterium]|nr:ABC transporter ATP-binding protein [Cytophagales bacterium]MDW8384267.1 ABC transporter ATP-binding protein [Flammeovirgaceae bacterium]